MTQSQSISARDVLRRLPDVLGDLAENLQRLDLGERLELPHTPSERVLAVMGLQQIDRYAQIIDDLGTILRHVDKIATEHLEHPSSSILANVKLEETQVLLIGQAKIETVPERNDKLELF